MKIFFSSILAILLAVSPVSAQSPGYSIASDGLTFPSIAWASLGDATSTPGKAYFVPDAPSGPSLVISDGTGWKPFARGLNAQKYTLLSGDAGTHTFTYSQSVKPNVQFSIEDNTTTALLTSNLQSVSSTSATVRVNRGLLAALTGGTTTGVTINILVAPNS